MRLSDRAYGRLKWCVASATILVCLVWLGTSLSNRRLYYTGERNCIDVGSCGIDFSLNVDPNLIFGEVGWSVIESGDESFEAVRPHVEKWYARQGFLRDDRLIVVIPFWCLLLPLLPATWILFRRDRRSGVPTCRCGYCLIGNTSGICPECGRPARAAHAR